MLITQLFCLLFFLPLADGEQEVVLTNGARLLARAVTREGDAFVIRFEAGILRLDASLVRDVRAAEPRPEPAPGPVAQPVVAEQPEPLTPVRAIMELRTERLQVGPVHLSVSIPNRFRRSAVRDPSIVTFLTEDQQQSIRLSRADTGDRSWQVAAAVVNHHRDTYTGYRTLAQRYTMLAGRRAWLLTFSYQKDDARWSECQGFVELESGVFVISASTREESGRRAANLVHTVGESLTTDGAGGSR